VFVGEGQNPGDVTLSLLLDASLRLELITVFEHRTNAQRVGVIRIELQNLIDDAQGFLISALFGQVSRRAIQILDRLCALQSCAFAFFFDLQNGNALLGGRRILLNAFLFLFQQRAGLLYLIVKLTQVGSAEDGSISTRRQQGAFDVRFRDIPFGQTNGLRRIAVSNR
jgi:hypothetical protein